MKKSELRPGVEYAVGSTSRYDRFRAVKVTLVDVEGERRRSNGTTAKGIVVSYDGEGHLRTEAGYIGSALSVERMPSGEWVLDSARWIREPWESFAEKHAAHEAAEERRTAERDRRRKVMAECVVALRGYGFDAEDRHTRDFRMDFSRLRFEVDPDALAELLRRADPVKNAQDVLDFVQRAHPKSEEEYDATVDAALAELRAGLRVTDAELAEKTTPDPESF